MLWTQYVLIGLAAMAAGFVNALAGGGTLISFPALVAVGLPAVAANVTNTVALVPFLIILVSLLLAISDPLRSWLLRRQNKKGATAMMIVCALLGEALRGGLAGKIKPSVLHWVVVTGLLVGGAYLIRG